MKVLIIGCGRVGAALAYSLYKKDHEVSVIDSIAAAFNNLPAGFTGRTHEGDPLNHDLLHRAGIETADALAAVTSSDALNAVVGHIAREIYKIPKVVVRNFDPNIRSIFESFDLQVVSSTSWGAQRVEELIYHSEVRSVFSTGNGEVEVYELPVPEMCGGKTLGEMLISKECIAVALTHAGKSQLPDSATRLEAGDMLMVSATFDGIEAMRRNFYPRQKET
jgi:trk system potassium uptake protein TrkA